MENGPLAALGGHAVLVDETTADGPWLARRGLSDRNGRHPERRAPRRGWAVPKADLPALRADLTDLVRPYLIVSVQDSAEFADAQGASIDTLINLLYVLLLFSVIVAVLGIINTLALSVFERTREIGLLRAIGLRRRQLSCMITIEAVTTAVFGALLGTALGLGLGVALQRGLVAQGLTSRAIPWSLILTMLVASGVVGVLAAGLPAMRAMRLNILQAIVSS